MSSEPAGEFRADAEASEASDTQNTHTENPANTVDDSVELVAASGISGFESFFVEHHPRVVRACTLALGDVELGRDAAAEGFTRALQRWNKVVAYDNPSGWVYRVSINWARSRRRKTVREVANRPTDHVFSHSEPNPTLARALRSLTVEHRAVVVGRYYLDWSEADTAAALNIPAGTVKSRLSRALNHLDTLLHNDSPSAQER